MLVVMSMVQMLDEHWPEKLERERITARLGPTLAADLYPTGSWRDHPPITNEVPITAPNQILPDVPPDESQNGFGPPAAAAPRTISPRRQAHRPHALRRLRARCESRLEPVGRLRRPHRQRPRHALERHAPRAADSPTSGTRPASRRLACTCRSHGARAAADRRRPQRTCRLGIHRPLRRHAGSVRRAHQRAGPGPGAGRHLAPHRARAGDDPCSRLARCHRRCGAHRTRPRDHPADPRREAHHRAEVERVRSAVGGLSASCYEPGDGLGAVSRRARAHWWAPTQNVVYADDQGHIGYQAVGYIPLRPGGLAGVPIADEQHEWQGFIGFDQLPSASDPPDGLLATANARVTPNPNPPTTPVAGAPVQNAPHVSGTPNTEHRTPQTPEPVRARRPESGRPVRNSRSSGAIRTATSASGSGSCRRTT